MSKTKLGSELREGDVIKFWSFDQQGARIDKLWNYSGRYPQWICANARLVGKHSIRGHQHLMETAIETNMTYEVLKEGTTP